MASSVTRARVAFGIFTLLALLLGSCLSPKPRAETPEAEATKNVQSSATITMRPSAQLSTFASTPHLPTETSQPESSPIVKALSQPTYDVAQRQAIIVESLTGMSDCDLPCILAVVPGVSRLMEIHEHFVQMGWTWSPFQVEADVNLHYETNPLIADPPQPYPRLSIYADGETVSSVKLSAEGYGAEVSFNELWSNYMPRAIIARFGAPTDVIINTTANAPTNPENPRMGYNIYLIYGAQGFVIGYSGAMPHTFTPRFCPDEQGDQLMPSIRIYTQSTDEPLDIDQALSRERYNRRYFVSLSEQLGADMGVFAARYDVNAPACFEYDSSHWP